jgi:hypothetical protein
VALPIDEHINVVRESILAKARHFTANPGEGHALGYSPYDAQWTKPEANEKPSDPPAREVAWVRCVAEQDVPLAYHWHVEEGLFGFYDLVIVLVGTQR